MIKIFRKIRQKLVHEGKTTNYLKYAIGEIFLVVIGILIALQINNSNELRKERQVEKEYVISLMEDLAMDASKLSILVKIYEKKELEIDTVLHLFSKLAHSYNDTLWRNLPTVVQFPDFIYTDRTMQQLKNSGGMRFIANKNALNSIIDYDLSVKHLLESYVPDLNFYYENSNEMWFEIFDIAAYETDVKLLSTPEMANGNKNYLLKNDPATLGKFNNVIRHFKADVTLVKETETELENKARQLITLLKKEYQIK